MLSDEELQAIANEFAREQQDKCTIPPDVRSDTPWCAVPICELETPPGVYFFVGNPGDVEGLQPDYWCSESGDLLDGFFVYRENGQVRVVTGKEMARTESQAPKEEPWPRLWAAGISIILTGSLPTGSVRVRPHPLDDTDTWKLVTLHRNPRPWWKFW